MTDYPIIIHGSENSLDIDAYVLVPSILDFKAAKSLCDSFREINANLLYVENGEVAWCYKGTKDECNNSILATYSLHEQKFDNPITQTMSRQYGLKMVRTIRGLLSYNSRTSLREEIKKALTSPSLDLKIQTMKLVNLNQIEDFQKTSKIETYKFFAFQMGQCLALIEDNVELFTKNSVAQYYPQLTSYLKREESSSDELQKFYERFISFVEKHYKKVDKHDWYATDFHGVTEVVDCKKEITLPRVVIFDIDGTLMNETHRSHLRDAGKWEEYFNLCHLDTPIDNIVALTHEYRKKGYEIWLMSGGSISCEEKTKASMIEHKVEYDILKLRGKDVMVPDYVLKPAWVSKYVGLERVDAVYDDTPSVIEGFRKKGLHVIDVNSLLNPSKIKLDK